MYRVLFYLVFLHDLPYIFSLMNTALISEVVTITDSWLKKAHRSFAISSATYSSTSIRESTSVFSWVKAPFS